VAASLPSSSPQQTYSAKFAKVYLNGQLVAGATDVEFGMNYEGTWEQTIGTDRPTRNPDKRYGDGTIQQIRWKGASITDICVAAGVASQQDLLTGDADLRFITFTLAVPYSDGGKQSTSTMFDVYIEKARRRLEGNRLTMDTISFAYSVDGES
jgi:hypothetical protein